MARRDKGSWKEEMVKISMLYDGQVSLNYSGNRDARQLLK